MRDDVRNQPMRPLGSSPAEGGGEPPPAAARPAFPERMVRGAAGTVLARPWFDAATLYALRHWFFPVSRLWAAAHLAEGDPEKFFEAVPMRRRSGSDQRLRRALIEFEKARAGATAIEAEWERTFFGPRDTSHAYRAALETVRFNLRHRYNATRWRFGFLIGRDVPRAKPAVATPGEADAIYAMAFADLDTFTSGAAAGARVETSRALATPTGRDYWLRYESPSPRLNDTVYARVHEPDGVRDPPTIIFGHGICVEFDHWRGLIDESRALVSLGFRVIRPEAPWHGRRGTPGRFAGEHIVASFPTGPLDAILGAVREWAVLAGWARATSSGALAFGGSSLGALTAQLAADRAAGWPERLRPDALLLITHSAGLTDVFLNGALAQLWLSPADVQCKGWTEDLARKYMRLLDPVRSPVVPARRIVSVLGRRDVVLPFEGGRNLVEHWCVPEANLFIWDRGHFSVPLTLIRNDGPLRRLREIMAEQK